MPDEMFVSGVEAERQQIETKTLGNDIAHALADRRASYTRKLQANTEDETNFVEVCIILAYYVRWYVLFLQGCFRSLTILFKRLSSF